MSLDREAEDSKLRGRMQLMNLTSPLSHSWFNTVIPSTETLPHFRNTLSVYSKMAVKLVSDWTGVKLSNILGRQAAPVMTRGLDGYVLLLRLHLGCTTDRRIIPFGYLLSSGGSVPSESSSVFWSLYSQRSWRTRPWGAGILHVSWCTDILGSPFLSMFLRTASLADEACLFW
jgi:hypothetical protein